MGAVKHLPRKVQLFSTLCGQTLASLLRPGGSPSREEGLPVVSGIYYVFVGYAGSVIFPRDDENCCVFARLLLGC